MVSKTRSKTKMACLAGASCDNELSHLANNCQTMLPASHWAHINSVIKLAVNYVTSPLENSTSYSLVLDLGFAWAIPVALSLASLFCATA